jgi:hypothetical protein
MTEPYQQQDDEVVEPLGETWSTLVGPNTRENLVLAIRRHAQLLLTEDLTLSGFLYVTLEYLRTGKLHTFRYKPYATRGSLWVLDAEFLT